MESTVDLVFVYAFADFYLKQANKDASHHADLVALVRIYGLDNLTKFTEEFKYRVLRNSNIELDTGISKLKYSRLSTQMDYKAENNKLYKFIALIIDTSGEVVRNDEKLRDLVLIHISYFTNYDYLNTYKQ